MVGIFTKHHIIFLEKEYKDCLWYNRQRNRLEESDKMKQKIVVIIGPTAVGKTDFSIQVAKQFNGEIISGDSMQVYKNLNIGTAKIPFDEMDGIPHHLIDFKEIDEPYDVSDFQKDAKEKVIDISKRDRLPIIVGGTGLYIESLLYPVSHGRNATPNEEFRIEMNQFAHENSNLALWKRLENIDPEAAKNIHPNNVRRVIRALEVYHETGELFSSFQNEKKNKEPEFDAYIVCLDTDRELLYERINKRVDLMFEEGLLEEAKTLWEELGPDPEAQSTKAIGYSELFSYFNHERSLQEAVDLIKQNSRRYAKRQLTWFRNRLGNVQWYNFIENKEDKEKCINEIKSFLEDE